MDFMNELKKAATKLTENGAVSYASAKDPLVTLNFRIPSFRSSGINTALFSEVLKRDRALALRWLLYLRDVRGGIGERKAFRDFLVFLAAHEPALAAELIAKIPIEEFGRWDDYLDLLWRTKDEAIKGAIVGKLQNQLAADGRGTDESAKNVSQLAKWLPSENTASQKTRHQARKLMELFGLDAKTYRKTLAKIRKYLNVVERQISRNEWNDVRYETVPSRANLLYRNAFVRHDQERRNEYLQALKRGETKINADAMFLHDICAAYTRQGGWQINCEADAALEALWAAQKKPENFENTLVVRDGISKSFCLIFSLRFLF